MTETLIRRARWVALAICALAAFLISLGPAAAPNSPTAMLPDGFDSTTVAAARAASGDPGAGAAVVLYTGLAPKDLALIKDKAAELGGPMIPNEAGDAAIVPVTVESESLTDNVDVIGSLREAAAVGLPEGAESSVTGPAAIEADLSAVFSGANVTLLAVTASIVAILLVLTYRSPILWILPLLVIGLADRLVATTYTRVLDTFGMQFNESTGGILSVLVFGAGTNYALLLISRYRDELTRTPDRFTAMARAWRPTVATITASAATVVIGVACLLLSHTPSTRALGAAAAFGVAVALFFGAVVLPGILVIPGRWVFWPRRPQLGEEPTHRLFDSAGRLVAARPVAVLAASLGLLGALSLGALGIQTGLTQSDQFIDTPESISAADDLAQAFPQKSATPAIVVSDDPARATAALEQAGLDVMSTGGTELQVSGGDTETIRAALEGTGAKVGGLDAELFDTEQAAEQDRALIFPVVLLLIFGALVVLLRSLVAPLIMTASVLLTNVAALGIGWWVSHHVFGFERFDSATPLYAFVFLVALGIDYTIFLVTRAREDASELGTRRGVLTALSTTGGVITSAGILLAAVFAALGVLPLVVLAQIGIVICLGVLLDTLIVRSLVVPAVVQVLGERFWWPSRPGAARED
ncbi:MMPL family transporter [Corynebacterium liangguodongii]|uniref:Uncharacterized protein n=1 Tax=Corynebacterium liangguodongii TaxID=2079535 RepID=A0A2S0WEN7_9CORY|nr:MMPL family transporter [Corynebacterium liangguodongii]AWB84229.1 hypothetical protein C3E79_06830 [Corynebacterium liangguodongii]PWC00238.1 hypothetical protein DF219_03465 [Corynebacterium liangguodongii]